MKKCTIKNNECKGPIDTDHVKTRATGGPDCFQSNIMFLCRNHHNLKGSKGINFMCEKYPSYKKKLIELGWCFEEFRGKWINYSLYTKTKEKI